MASNLVFVPLDKFKLSCFVRVIIMRMNMTGWGLEGSKIGLVANQATILECYVFAIYLRTWTRLIWGFQN